jgi:hypothetical protein
MDGFACIGELISRLKPNVAINMQAVLKCAELITQIMQCSLAFRQVLDEDRSFMDEVTLTDERSRCHPAVYSQGDRIDVVSITSEDDMDAISLLDSNDTKCNIEHHFNTKREEPFRPYQMI